MEFTFEDAEELWSLVSSQESLVDKKRRSVWFLLPGHLPSIVADLPWNAIFGS
jgi:hypothetical protein